MRKIILFIFCMIFSNYYLKASEYIFEGIEYIYVSDTCFCFNNGKFEIKTCDEKGSWSSKFYPYTLSKEGAYLVANVKKETIIDKLYIFCADKKHLIFYDSDENYIYDTTEKIGHIDEAWILSGIDYTASSFLSEILNDEKVDYIPENLSVEKLTKSWVEGVSGDGINEKISFVNRPFNGSRRIYIINGFFSFNKPSLFYDNNRVKTLLINCYKEGVLVDTIEKDLKDTGEMQLLEFSDRYSSFDFIIKDVYKGRKYNDTALTGIFIDALDGYID